METSKEEQNPWLHPLAVVRGRKDKEWLQTMFYDASTNRCITKSLPEMRNKVICSSPYGWLVTKDVDSNDYSLFHLESKMNIKLPPVQPQQRFCFLSSPPTDPDCRVVFYDESVDNNNVLICKPGDDKFAIQQMERQIGQYAVHQGTSYSWVTLEMSLDRIEFVDSQIQLTTILTIEHNHLPDIFQSKRYLVGSQSHDHDHDLYLLEKIYFGFFTEFSTFRVNRMDFARNQWTRVRSIGEVAIFGFQ
ncbi:hypothetical protein CCACVL1_01536 [Corchorus capsularis]|uniref:KIB1-4 beta-propeller domain-containing protein n=1 Tax=Corchorus capsularis TaxID=210143 RepID=A0A1R3KHD9_COCAP|nr:hypothetical protein CCACVL1_01536 [Corchorus capsularis]